VTQVLHGDSPESPNAKVPLSVLAAKADAVCSLAMPVALAAPCGAVLLSNSEMASDCAMPLEVRFAAAMVVDVGIAAGGKYHEAATVAAERVASADGDGAVCTPVGTLLYSTPGQAPAPLALRLPMVGEAVDCSAGLAER
jgi:hypothetical protein